MIGWTYSMDFGLIGKNINYSYSQEIHKLFGDNTYEIINLEIEELADFLKKKEFKGLNVTIPYKQKVIPYLDSLDELATKTGVVNTIINEHGLLKGYNTDYLSFTRLLTKEKINLSGKKCLILGSGATSKTVFTVLKDLGAFIIAIASRTPQVEMVSYESLYRQSYDIVINTTPVGTYPHYNEEPVDLDKFMQIEVLIDFTYNPLRTKLIKDAMRRTITAMNGLELLVAQAYFSRQLFDQRSYEEAQIEKIVQKIYQNKLNIVLIGMPYSGKSTIARLLGTKLARQVIDIDDLIEQKAGESITNVFIKKQEAGFREIEKQVIAELSECGCVIATGGGSVLDEDNMAKLCSEGIVFYLRRDKETITIANSDRPLLKNMEDWVALATKREHLYINYADYVIENHSSYEAAIRDIEEYYWKYIKRGK